MKKSIPSGILGIIFSIIGAIAGYVFWVMFVIVAAFAVEPLKTIAGIAPLINLIMFAISFIGSIFCFFKVKVGAILMFIASLISLICLTTVFVIFKTVSPAAFLICIPTAILFINSVICIIISKKKKVLT